MITVYVTIQASCIIKNSNSFGYIPFYTTVVNYEKFSHDSADVTYI